MLLHYGRNRNARASVGDGERLARWPVPTIATVPVPPEQGPKNQIHATY